MFGVVLQKQQQSGLARTTGVVVQDLDVRKFHVGADIVEICILMFPFNDGPRISIPSVFFSYGHHYQQSLHTENSKKIDEEVQQTVEDK